MRRQVAGRRAPHRWATTPGQAAPAWASVWRGLTQAYVPDAGGTSATVGSRRMVELLHGAPTNQGAAANFGIEGFAAGRAMSVTGNPGSGLVATNSAKWGPAVGAPFSVFAYVVRKDASATFQALIGNGFTGLGGWTFQANYTSGRIGLTRWGNGDDHTTATLGSVPNDGTTPSGMGVAWAAGGPARFFLNGLFEQLASGTISGAGIGDFVIGRTSSGGLQSMGIHVIYMWNRVLTDGEFQRLYRDPFGPIRPWRHPRVRASASSTDLRATQLLAEVAVTPAVALHLTQLVAEVLVTDTGNPDLRATQLVAEVLHAADPALRASQLLAEILATPTVQLRATQLLAEVLTTPTVALRATQLVAEVLIQPTVLSVTKTGLLFPRGSVPPF